MDVHALKKFIIEDESRIVKVLEFIDLKNINDNFSQGREFRCAWEDGSNPTAVRVCKDSLSANYFSKGIKGDLITLVQERLNLDFPQSLKKISSVVGFAKEEEKEANVILPFGGFYKKINKIKKREFIELKTYDEDVLNEYHLTPSKMFLKDGISYDVQRKYKIFYDVMSDRIGVPWRNLTGELVGIMGRLNKYEIDDFENKWMPIQPFQKSKTIFGFSENYHSIQNKGVLFVGESEKFTMQLSSHGVDLGLSLGGNNLSQFQANNIKSLFAKRIIVSLDEGLDEQVSVDMARRLKQENFFQNEVLYIYDRNNKYLPKGSKMSPSDLSKNQFRKIVMECCKKV